MNRHAYLIMAHNHIENLQALLSAIDDERNAVFLHIDKKSLNKENWDALSMSHASFYRVPSMEVNWAGYSQVACTLRLMEHEVKHGPYQYYHLL
ncbi:MAG: hypothetical protein J6D18_05235, partial [Erysipelotrichaceae bacterium]|nr:hypothetical protein [Erysipelotrichaceae bacterium]